MSKLSKKNVGNIIRITIDNEEYCHARIIEDLDFLFYDYKISFKNNNLAEIVNKDILFASLVSFNAIKQGNWEIIGNLPLDERHKITPIYFHPDMTNAAIIDYTVEKIKQTMEYKTFEKRGLQYGGVHSAISIKRRLEDYYSGKDYSGITALLRILKNLKEFS